MFQSQLELVENETSLKKELRLIILFLFDLFA